MRSFFRVASVLSLSMLALLALPGSASAATVTQTPTISWAPWKSCGDTSTENCAQVRAIAKTADGTVFLGGDFTQLRSPDGAKSVAVSNLAALGSDGAPLASYTTSTFNGAVHTLATDGATVYVGGSFTRINDKYAARVARFDADSGSRLGFSSGVNGPVFASVLRNGKFYIGGKFSAVQSLARGNLAALDAATGKVDGAWTPVAELLTDATGPNSSKYNNTPIRAMAVSLDGNRLFVGGDMDRINGLDRPVVAALDPAVGAVDASFAPGSRLDKSYQAMQIAPDTLGGMALATGGVINRGWRLGADGSERWFINTNGDVQAAAISGGTVYFGGHFTKVCRVSCYDSNTADDTKRMHIAAFDDLAATRPDPDPTWAPALGPATSPYFYGVYTLLVADRQLYAGGVWKYVYASKFYAQPKFASFKAL